MSQQETIVQFTLTTLTYGGEAMGRLPDGRACFVPFGLPGETIRARLTESRKNFARAQLIEIITPSAERITPACQHFSVCGGCHYQHLPYQKQLQIKKEIIQDQLTRIGKINQPPVFDTIPSPEIWRYRNHIQFHLTNSGKLGYVEAGYPWAVFPIEECHLPQADLNALWPSLEFEAGSGVERVSLRAGDDVMIMLESDSYQTPEMNLESDVSVVHLADENTVIMAGSDVIPFTVLERVFHVSAASFFQTNTQMAEKMVQHVLALIPAKTKTIVDVYCGVGLFSAFLADKCEQLIGIELSASACEDFAHNLDEFENVELYEAAAEEVLPVLAVNADVIVVDPPRAGLEKEALDAIVTKQPPLLIYISCDPSTLARDAARLLAGGYTLKQVTPFDMFPQTYHIESISVFTLTR